MIYSNEVIIRNVRVKELLNEIGYYKQRDKYFHPYINWRKVPSHTIKELIELEALDLGRDRFLHTPITKLQRNILVHRLN